MHRKNVKRVSIYMFRGPFIMFRKLFSSDEGLCYKPKFVEFKVCVFTEEPSTLTTSNRLIPHITCSIYTCITRHT